VPSRGAGPDTIEKIAGTVRGVNIKDCKVIILCRTDSWYVQPYAGSSDTAIADDGKWENETHLGSEYAALLVKSTFALMAAGFHICRLSRSVIAKAIVPAVR